MANTKLLEREIHNFSRPQPPLLAAVRRDLPDVARRSRQGLSLAKAAVEARKGCTFVRCAILGFGPSSIDFELLFDVRSVDVNKVAADRTAVALERPAQLRRARHRVRLSDPDDLHRRARRT